MNAESIEEARKIQLTGRSTYTVSLPKKWVTKRKLKPGEQLLIKKQPDGSLSIRTRSEEEEEPRAAKFKVSRQEPPETLARKIVSAYLAGYITIEVGSIEGSMSPVQKDAVKEMVRKQLVGTEIVDESSSHMNLQVLLRIPEFDIKSALRRMVRITASMHRDAIQSLRELNPEVAREVIKADDDVDRFNLYIIRQLKEALESEKVLAEMEISTPSHCLGYRVITKSVERVADHASKIAENVLNMKNPPSRKLGDEIFEMSDLAAEVFEASVDSLFKEDYGLAEKVVMKAKNVVAMEQAIIKLLKGADEREGASLRLILEDIKRTAEYASDIAEIVLNRTIEHIASPKPS